MSSFLFQHWNPSLYASSSLTYGLMCIKCTRSARGQSKLTHKLRSHRFYGYNFPLSLAILWVLYFLRSSRLSRRYYSVKIRPASASTSSSFLYFSALAIVRSISFLERWPLSLVMAILLGCGARRERSTDPRLPA